MGGLKRLRAAEDGSGRRLPSKAVAGVGSYDVQAKGRRVMQARGLSVMPAGPEDGFVDQEVLQLPGKAFAGLRVVLAVEASRKFNVAAYGVVAIQQSFAHRS